MSMLMIKCPATGRPVPTGIEIEPDTLAQLPDIGSGLTCPACGHHHIWQKNDAWIGDGGQQHGRVGGSREG
jgi:hypothetical protein